MRKKKSKMHWLNKSQGMRSLRILFACNSFFCLKCKRDRMWLTSEPNPSVAVGITKKVRGFMRISVILLTPEPSLPSPRKFFKTKKSPLNGKSEMAKVTFGIYQSSKKKKELKKLDPPQISFCLCLCCFCKEHGEIIFESMHLVFNWLHF